MPAQKSDDADKLAEAGATPPPPDDFHKFLVSLATDPAKLGAFIKDPDAAMTAAGLSEADQAVLKSGHPWMIHGRLSGQSTQLMLVTPPPITLLIVDLAAAEGGQVAGQPTVRQLPQGSQPMYPNYPIYPPPVHPIYPPPVYPVVYPQVHPQLVIHPQVVHPVIVPPQQVIHPQIVHPQVVVHPQIHPLIYPIQPVFPPPVTPVYQPQQVEALRAQYSLYPQYINLHPIFPIYPPPQIHPIWPPPQIHPIYPPPVIQQLYPPVYPQLLIYSPYARPAGT